MGTETNRRTRIADEIRSELARRRMSQAQLSAITGITKNTLRSRLQGVRPFNLDEVDRICFVLDMPMVELISRSDDQ
jgi:DNA-binding Xre family transcriptional regulator